MRVGLDGANTEPEEESGRLEGESDTAGTSLGCEVDGTSLGCKVDGITFWC